MGLSKKQIELIVIRNPINTAVADVERYLGNDVVELMQRAFNTDTMPSGVHLYHNALNADCEVTPKTKKDVKRLLRLNGRIYAVVMPQGLSVLAVVLISVAVSVAIALLMPIPQVPNATTSNTPPSPNNALAQRTNRLRLGGRIPDIVGEVWSVPDLVANTYSVYIDHIEIEYSLMCIGRGRYNVARALDDTTDVEQIIGTNVQVYNPGQNIVFDTPAFEFGNAYRDAEYELSRMAVRRYTAVNGQVLPRPDNFFTADNNVTFKAPNIIEVIGDRYSFEGNFSVGDTITVESATDLASALGLVAPTDPSNPNTQQSIVYNLNGVYTVASVTNKTIILDNPQLVNPDWQLLINNNDQTLNASPTISTESNNLWSGWHYTSDPDAKGIIINLIAQNGIYSTHPDGDKYSPFEINFVVEIERLDSNGAVINNSLTSQYISIGGRDAKLNTAGTAYLWTTSDNARRTAAVTHKIKVGGRVRMRIRRTSKKQQVGKQQLVDEVKFKDLYSYRHLTSIGDAVNNDVTLVYVKTRATEGALAVKERKLRLLVQRYLHTPNSLMILSKNADDIIYHMATDNKVGNLSDAQIDMAQIKAEMDIQRAYFGTDKCSEFCYTFDDNNISSEETLQSIAQAVFGQLYRFNNKLQLHFERPQNVGVAIFNSHNILPDTYEHSESFGINKDYDGVIVKYVDSFDDAQITAKVPSAALLNADEHMLVGVRNERQALVHAWRIWNKHLHSYKTVEFVGADESNIVVRSQRIDVTPQYRADTVQGTVTDIKTINNQIVMTLSEPLLDDMSNGTLFLQMTNAQVDYMQIERIDDFTVALPRLPQHTISTSLNNVVQATYQIVANRHAKRDAYIVTAKDPNDNMTNKISAINYDARYYAGDT